MELFGIDFDNEELKEETENVTFKDELKRQKKFNIQDRLNQPLFNGEDFSMFRIALDYMNEYAASNGVFPDLVKTFFSLWINNSNESLPFSEIIRNEIDIDDFWVRVPEFSLHWITFANLARRLVSIGVSEADVERLFS